jgi:methyl coenzyme M reductase gamma subunit
MMPGFVDVSNMSSLEIKRLGQMDDDTPYRNPYAYRKPVARTTKVIVTYNADDVWAAAVQAQAINGRYIKVVDYGLPQKTNRQIVDELLKDTTQITQENRDQGIAVRQYFKGLTFKLLEGKTLNDFNNTAMTIASKDAIAGNYDLAVIVSLPATYEKSSKRDSIDRRINFARGGYLGDLGDKVTVEIEVVKQIFSQKWNTWYITGLTGDDKVLFFAYKSDMNIGDRVTIQGTVKTFRDNSTQLNRVKVIV